MNTGSESRSRATASAATRNAPWSPFRHATFTVLWIATVVSNIGSWMYSAASGWLMTSLNPDPFIVSMVQVATTLPILLFAFLIGAAGALTGPAWQAVVPQLVPREDLHSAVAANSAGVNVSRAVGPALGGIIVSALGIAAPFWINAISNLG